MVMSTPFLSFPSCAEVGLGEPMRSFCGSKVATAPIAEVFRKSLLLLISRRPVCDGKLVIRTNYSKNCIRTTRIDRSNRRGRRGQERQAFLCVPLRSLRLDVPILVQLLTAPS